MRTYFKNVFLWFRSQFAGSNDPPHKIAVGFGLGIFTGIFPGIGPVAAVALAIFLGVNRAAAFTGSLLTNTWMSLVTFVLSLQIGAMLLGKNWEELGAQYKNLLRDFHWKDLGDWAFVQILLPVFVGYAVVGLIGALIGYGVCWVVLKIHRKQVTGLS